MDKNYQIRRVKPENLCIKDFDKNASKIIAGPVNTKIIGNESDEENFSIEEDIELNGSDVEEIHLSDGDDDIINIIPDDGVNIINVISDDKNNTNDTINTTNTKTISDTINTIDTNNASDTISTSDTNNTSDTISTITEGNECSSEECIQTSKRMLEYMDISVDPCEDFYHFTCGGWESKLLSNEIDGKSITGQLNNKARKEVREIIEGDYIVDEKLSKEDQIYDEKLFKKLKNIYNV
ncbi:hypothetical protein BCR32DRAFT_248823 [Anaeromyces robustus]|uniref:Zincin n=1 Tax=Anaeromyces robustus TaxID=1754192 RepID=A0A1Y1WSY5_9FUNG|nr:hypothetical protein BCR32DRAFT_248823 [Anaeromyces robustus]|eukprot:ORX76356.1 hypothetical protein BCR32DRAFT_248823 [Anaeromyces robustus]